MIWLLLVPMFFLFIIVLVSYPSSHIVIPNTITEHGFGVKWAVLVDAKPLFGSDFANIFRAFLVVGGIIMGLGVIGRVLKGAPTGWGRSYVWWMLVASAVFPLVSDFFSDRYLIPLLPLLFILLIEGLDSKVRLPRLVWVLPVVFIIACGFLANEYFAWNTARWKAIDDAERNGHFELTGVLDIERQGVLIDGGLEFTAFRYYNNDKFMERFRAMWERAGEPVPPEEREEFGYAPDYFTWWNLPKEYDFIVREEVEPGGVLYPDGINPWVIYGRAEYKPFPWSKAEALVVYRPSQYPGIGPH
jgi:hypothetical protein